MANTADFNRAKCTFPTTSNVLGTGLRDASWSRSGADVDLTVTTSASGLSRPGIRHKELNVTVLGNTTVSRGDTGAIKLIFGTTADNAGVWNIGTTGTLRAYVASKSVSGSMDGEVTTSFTFRPYATS